ncbi:extracellular solute-binding protein [Vibrio breoganii]|uniref:extracellular solute-binding protein n=1 Tax=Vibrio breoganii TaxID=553239 RepID=UPI0002FD23F6|nr:extracellular solute-binding protein [Vibrio breoganii]OED91613.1 antibiotic ABC transporter substrate-binding protein [Vibrio breoganii ZF-55]
MLKRTLLTGAILCSPWLHAEVIESTYLSGFGEAKHPSGFEHLDYVNPSAPKGGHVTYGAIGTYDSFNRYGSRGKPGAMTGEIYDTLMFSPTDEINTSYPLIAEKVRYEDDFSWMEVDINPKAKFQDGVPITAKDVEFTFQKFLDQGVPQYKTYFKKIKSVKAINDKTARIELAEPDRDVLFALVQGMAVLPEHFWKDKDLSQPLSQPPVGSGPYKIDSFKSGQSITYARVTDYWAETLPVNIGRNNFDTIQYDYYRDDTVMLEAFKAGEYDLRQEGTAKFWATSYTGSNFDKGYIIKEEIAHQIPQSMQGFIYNTESDIFKDPKVREALTYALDFEWMNKNMFYHQYARTSSYFQNTEYQAKGKPSAEELEILEPIKDQVPERVFGESYAPPKSDASGRIRIQMRTAIKLLKEAGWETKNGVLTNSKTGKPFEFELLVYSPTTERIADPLKKNLSNIGINMKIRTVDTTQYLKRWHERDYDMIFSSYSANAYPSTNLKIAWNSNFIDSTYNQAGVRNKAIDYLTEEIDTHQQDPERLKALGPALDRVLTWNFYAIPAWHTGAFRVASWDKFARPDIRPEYDLGLDTWWVDTDKAQKLPAKRR